MKTCSNKEIIGANKVGDNPKHLISATTKSSGFKWKPQCQTPDE